MLKFLTAPIGGLKWQAKIIERCRAVGVTFFCSIFAIMLTPAVIIAERCHLGADGEIRPMVLSGALLGFALMNTFLAFIEVSIRLRYRQWRWLVYPLIGVALCVLAYYTFDSVIFWTARAVGLRIED